MTSLCGGRTDVLTIPEAISCLSGFVWPDDKPAWQTFLRSGKSCTPHACYRIFADDVDAVLAEFRDYYFEKD